MAFDSKKKIEVRVEVLKTFHGQKGGGVVKVIEIFERKPRSFKSD